MKDLTPLIKSNLSRSKKCDSIAFNLAFLNEFSHFLENHYQGSLPERDSRERVFLFVVALWILQNPSLVHEISSHSRRFSTWIASFLYTNQTIVHFLLENISTNSFHAVYLEKLQEASLDRVYESCLQAEHAKKEGIYYTPHGVADLLLRKVLHLSDRLPQYILDPSCGGGVFLKRLSPYTPTSTLYGVDKDPYAVALAKLTLLSDAWKRDPSLNMPSFIHMLQTHIQIGNSLFDTPDVPFDLLKDVGPCFPFGSCLDIQRNEGFDLIIGNPPFGLSRDNRIHLTEKRLLEKTYESVLSGKIDTYLLFVVRAFMLLRPGGILGFIIPNSWMGIAGATKIRHLLLQKGSIEEIVSFQDPPFKNAGVEPVILIVRKSPPKTSIHLTKVDSELRVIEPATSIPLSVISSRPDYRIPSFWSDHFTSLLEHLHQSTYPLGAKESFFHPSIALQAYATGKGIPPQTKQDVENHIYHIDTASSPECIPYLEGKDVSPFEVNWSGRYLRYGPWLAEHQPKDRYMGPRILLREILHAPPRMMIAAYTRDPFTYNRSLLHILPKNGATEESLLALTGIFNSLFGSWLLGFFGRKSQRTLFPKILNADLQEFPLPKNWDPEVLANLVKENPLQSLLLIDAEVNRIYGVKEVPEAGTSLPQYAPDDK